MATLDRQVSASADDCGRLYSPTDYWSATPAWQNAGRTVAEYPDYSGAFRLLNITIPKGATITQAYFSIKCRIADSATTVNSRIRAQAADNPATFSTNTDFDARTWTAEVVNWDGIPAWTLNTWYNSPDIKTIIQAIVNRANWQSGNAIVICWDDWQKRSTQSDYRIRRGYSYDSGAANAPKLHIEYTAAQDIAPSAIASAEALGSPTVIRQQFLSPTAIASLEAFGSLNLKLYLKPTAIESAEAFGSPTLQQVGYLIPTAIASAETFGTPALIYPQFLSPTAIASAEAFGSPKLNLRLSPSPIASQEAFGTAKLTLYLLPTAIPSAEAFGSPTVIPGAAVIIPSGIASAETFGTLTLSFALHISPAAIASLEAFGTLALLRELFHKLLDAQYITETPEVNRAYVIGRDAEGNPVHGTDLEQAEIDLVGERLDFQQHLSIPTSALAADVADAMLNKQRLSKHRGFITIPPNAGAELWDVIQVTDTPCAQSASKYRVLAITFDYEPRQRRYQHKLFLAAP